MLAFCAIRLALANSLSMDFFLPPRLSDDSDRGNRDKKAGVNEDCGACTLAAAAAAAADDNDDDISVDDVIGLKCNKVESCNESKKVSIFFCFWFCWNKIWWRMSTMEDSFSARIHFSAAQSNNFEFYFFLDAKFRFKNQ